MIQIRGDSWIDCQRPDRFKCHTICIQDPFELDHNLAQGVDTESEFWFFEKEKFFFSAGLHYPVLNKVEECYNGQPQPRTFPHTEGHCRTINDGWKYDKRVCCKSFFLN